MTRKRLQERVLLFLKKKKTNKRRSTIPALMRKFHLSRLRIAKAVFELFNAKKLEFFQDHVFLKK